MNPKSDPGAAAPQRGNTTYGWRSRGYLPHFDVPGVIQHITYHLADSLPMAARDRIKEKLRAVPVEKQDIERRRSIEAYLDAGHGSCVLTQPKAARCVIETWMRFDDERYRLLAFVVMPNHCHVLIECLESYTLGKIVNSWKSYTARWINANVIEGEDERRAGARRSQVLWQREYWDRFIRDERHLYTVKRYIENNPVTAGLALTPEGWPWSSAAKAEQRTPA